MGFPSIETLIPHRHAMLLVDELLSPDGNSAVVKSVVRTEMAAVDNGKVASYWGIEIIAQSIAAFFGYGWISAGRDVSFGYIVAVDDFTVCSDVDPVLGDVLHCHIRLDYEAFPMGVYVGHIQIQDKVWATAKLKCFLSEQRQEIFT